MNQTTMNTDAKALEAHLNCQKAKVLLNDITGYFFTAGCMLPGYVPQIETVEAIREDFQPICVKLQLINDVLDMVDSGMMDMSSHNVVMTL